MTIRSFRELTVWQKSFRLATDVYSLTDQFPAAERFGLSSQIHRAAVSIPSNIAEGQKRLSNKETVQFSSIALGSLGELQTQLILCERLYAIEAEELVDECEQITKMLTSLIRSLRSKS